jgi:hypothetical protein
MARDLQLTRRPVIATALLGTASALLIAAGCRQSPPPPPKAMVVDPEPLTRAREAMDRRDYGAAVALLREAVARRSADLEAHYRLGVSASHLDQPDEASREFEWVVAHGAAGAPEVQISRDWLASRTSPRLPAVSVPSSGDRAQAPKPEMATLAGRAVGPEGARPRLQLFLKGIPGTAVKDEYHVLRTDQRGNFRFTNVVPGDYMLTNAVAGPPAWRLRVSLARGERLVLDLSPANHATVRDDFPEPRP